MTVEDRTAGHARGAGAIGVAAPGGGVPADSAAAAAGAAGPPVHGRRPVRLAAPGPAPVGPVSGHRGSGRHLVGGDPGDGDPPGPLAPRRAAPRARIRRPLGAPAVVAVCALGGGAGRTTIAVALSQLLAEVRGEPVAAVEAMTAPLGTMGSRAPAGAAVGLHEVAAADADGLAALQRRDGLSVVVGDRPDGRFLDGTTAARAVGRLTARFPLVVVDIAAAVTDRRGWWRWAAPDVAVATVLVCRATAADLRLAAEALPAVARAGGLDVSRMVVVANRSTGRSMDRPARLAEQLLAAQVPALVRLPFDRHLAGGGELRVDRLRRGTRQALERVGAAVAEHFG